MRKRYVGDLGRMTSEGSVAVLHWNRGYQEAITSIYDSVLNNIEFELFILNVSNFIRNFQEIDITSWYIDYFLKRGFKIISHEKIETKRQRGVGANTKLRAKFESVIVFKRTKPCQK